MPVLQLTRDSHYGAISDENDCNVQSLDTRIAFIPTLNYVYKPSKRLSREDNGREKKHDSIKY